MAEPLHTLTVTDLAEVSFVDLGDNPEAGVLLMKARPPTPSPEKPMPDGTLTNDEIAKLREEQAAEKARSAELEKRLAFFEKEREIGAIEKRIAALHLPATLAPDLYEIAKSAPDAAKRIEAEMVNLAKRATAADGYLTTRKGGPGAQVGSAAEQLDTLAKARSKEKGVPYADAYAQVTRENPNLYAEYKKEMV